MVAEQLADAPLGPIALDRDAHFPGCRDSQARGLTGAWKRKDNHVAALVFPAAVVDLLEFGPLADVLMSAEAPVRLHRL
jgi:hypothetical protein